MELDNFPEKEILDYWFSDCLEKPAELHEQGRLWFSVNEATDYFIKRTFGYLFPYLLEQPVKAFRGARSALAAVIVLDQFSRNTYRSTTKAFEYDRQALAIMDRAIEKGWDLRLQAIERAFLYMPLQHSESLIRQKQASNLYKELVLQSIEPYREYLLGMERFAKQHRMLIERFGRFPHRNVILGRKSTPEEQEYMQKSKQNFGQAPPKRRV